VHLFYAAGSGRAGQIAEARPEIDHILEALPGFCLSTLDEGPEFCMVVMSDRAEQYARQGLEKAGLPWSPTRRHFPAGGQSWLIVSSAILELSGFSRGSN
jgi:hypothetical protein